MPGADLNHIRTFVTLYETRSVTAAAEQLHVTQPTVSYTLGRLRRRFGDDLFRRQGHDFVPSSLATRLYGPLREALTQIDDTLAGPDAFDPAAHTDEFSLALSSLGEQTFLPRVMGHLLAEAPGVRLRSVPLVADRAESELVRGVIDLAVSVSLLSPERLWRTPFLPVEYVAVTAADAPLPPTGPRMFEGRRFVQVSGHAGHTPPNQALTEHGLLGQVALVVDSYGSVAEVVEASDLVVLLPRHVTGMLLPQHRLALHALPWPAPATPVSVYTRPEAALSHAQRWFRDVVLRALTP